MHTCWSPPSFSFLFLYSFSFVPSCIWGLGVPISTNQFITQPWAWWDKLLSHQHKSCAINSISEKQLLIMSFKMAFVISHHHMHESIRVLPTALTRQLWQHSGRKSGGYCGVSFCSTWVNPTFTRACHTQAHTQTPAMEQASRSNLITFTAVGYKLWRVT